ncbi:hypothetical protein E2K93_00700 [Thalassotalea sp. HSM 43]|uniref:hypothetical protein n=1 Tax=Thalassotalea sp. HSM 43 TaxID=2552945 RepID=UPI001081527C|nr:hypothetical protein [Thalassotalea sp. HSM 43]QBY02978.1 hypothetical protein E2K93_00700 [Thalassotalea sp. HSM 43]
MHKAMTLFTAIGLTVAMAAQASDERTAELEALLADDASKLIYLSRDCDMPIDAEKFKDLAALKAMMEGYGNTDNVDWEKVTKMAHEGYGKIKVEAPVGEKCPEYKEQLGEKYEWLKDINAG